MRARTRTAAVAALVVALAGCAGTEGEGGSTSSPRAPTSSVTMSSRTSSQPSTTPSRTSSRATTTSASTTPSPTVPDRPARTTRLTLAFGGDVHFEGFVRPLADDPKGLRELRSTLGAADLSMVNLESAITEGGTPLPDKAYRYRAPARVLDVLADAGVDVVGMANNHAVDFSLDGFADTLAAKRRSPIPVLGIGKDEDEAFAPASLEVKGAKVAVINGDQVLEKTLTDHSAGPGKPGVANALRPDRILAETRKARRTHDLVVVYLHWGIEPGECPDAASITLSRQLEQAGADVIVGGHTHRVNGAGWLGRAYVAYGLGNFVFYRTYEPSSRTGVLTLTLDVPVRAKGSGAPPARDDAPMVREADWTPMLINGDGVPRVPGNADRERLHRVWEQARACTPLRAAP